MAGGFIFMIESITLDRPQVPFNRSWQFLTDDKITTPTAVKMTEMTFNCQQHNKPTVCLEET